MNSSTDSHQLNFFGSDLLQQLDPADPLLQLSTVIPWSDFDNAFQKHYTQGIGAPSKPIRLMVGLLILKQLENLSDETVVLQWKRTYVKEVKNARLSIRHFRHIKKRSKAKKALKRLRTIAHILIRELRRTLSSYCLFERYQKDFLFYERVLGQQQKDNHKIYSLHEHQAYCIGKGKDHKPYEYGNKVSIAATAKSNIIVGVVSYSSNIYDYHTLPEVLAHIEKSRGKAAKEAVRDRGYRGKKKVGDTNITLPKKPLKKDNQYQRNKRRKKCQRRAAIEPIIGHLKTDFRLSRNFLKGILGDEIKLLMAATAWNLKKWLNAFFWCLFIRVTKRYSGMKHPFNHLCLQAKRPMRSALLLHLKESL